MTTSDNPPPAGPLAAMPAISAGRIAADGRRIYRLTTPVVLWWCWVAIAVFAGADALIQGNHTIPPAFAAGTLAITGVTFVCTLWPKVIAGEAGLTVQNPFRTFRIPWAAARGVFIGDSVEIQCARRPPKPDKTVYCWALFSSRRARARSELRMRARIGPRMGARQRGGSRAGLGGLAGAPRTAAAGHGQLPAAAAELLKKGPAELVAAELAQVLDQLPDADDTGGVVTASWAWLPLALALVPTLALVALLLA